MEVAFESLRSPMCAQGQVSRLVVNTGHRVTCMVPVFHLPNTTKSLDLVGIPLTTFPVEMPLGAGLPGPQGLDIVENITCRYCSVAPDFRKEPAQTKLGQWSLWGRSYVPGAAVQPPRNPRAVAQWEFPPWPNSPLKVAPGCKHCGPECAALWGLLTLHRAPGPRPGPAAAQSALEEHAAVKA